MIMIAIVIMLSGLSRNWWPSSSSLDQIQPAGLFLLYITHTHTWILSVDEPQGLVDFLFGPVLQSSAFHPAANNIFASPS